MTQPSSPSHDCPHTPPCDELEETRAKLTETERVLGETRRRVTRLEDTLRTDLPKLEELATEFMGAVQKVREEIERDLECIRVQEQETAQLAEAAMRRANRSGGQVIPIRDDFDEITENIPVERIMRHPAARELVQRELAAQEKLREKEDRDEMDARQKRRDAFWTRVYQFFAIVGTLGTLAKIIGIWK